MKRFHKYSSATPVSTYGIAFNVTALAFNVRWLVGPRVIIWSWRRQ